MSDAISGAAMRCKTMADGSLRIEVEVQPTDAQAAFALFGRPGAPMALAALKDGYAAHKDSYLPASEPAKPKGGAAAQWLGIKCSEPAFQEWVVNTFPNVERSGVVTADMVAGMVREICLVQSRADIDNDKAAFVRFEQYIRRPYMEFVA